MRQLLVLLVVATVASAAFQPDLKVKWGVGLSSGTDYIIDMPTLESEVVEQGWTQLERNSVHLPTLKMYCQIEDLSICFLYDVNGLVAGYQINIAVDKLTNLPMDLESLGFTTWSQDGVEYWSNELFLVDEDVTAESTSDEILRRDYVWVRGFNSKELVEVPTNPTDIEANTLFTKQGCIPTMGGHHYYNMSSDTPCDKMFPWFTLYDDGELIGMGFMVFGTHAEYTGDSVEKFERPARSAVEAIVPSAPQCLYEMSENPGVTTMHVYFISNPTSAGLNLSCMTSMG